MKKSFYCIFVVMVVVSSSLSSQAKKNNEEQVINSDSLASDKQRWLDHANRIERLLKQNAAYLQSLKNKDAKPETRWLDEADELIKQFGSEDRTNPAIDSLMQEFDVTYRLYSQEARQQRIKMEQYNRYSHFAVVFGGGGFFLYQKPGILFNYAYGHWHYGTRDFSFATSGHFSGHYEGFSSSGALSLFVEKNISLEFNYMYGKCHLSPAADILHLTPSPYSTPQIHADDYYISTSSINLIGNYLFEIIPGFKSIFGLGFTYIDNSSPEYVCLLLPTYADESEGV